MAEFNPKKITRDQIHNGLQYIFGDALSADDVNAIVEGLLYLSGFSGEVNFGSLLKATNANFVKVTSDSAEMNELSVNTLQSGLQKALAVSDNLLIVNAYGDESTVSGVVVLKGSDVIEGTENAYPAYGLLYDPVTNAMCVGDVTVLEGEASTGHEVTYNPETLIPLAARDGFFLNDEIPIWDAIKNAFVPSGLKKSDIGAGGGGITEYDFEITEPSQFTEYNLTTMSGNILVKCDIENIDEDVSVTIPEEIKLINFNGHRVNYSLVGHSACRLISADIGMSALSGATVMSEFDSVEFCEGYGCFSNCSRIAHSTIWNATNCTFITDVVTNALTQQTTFKNCSNITNVKVEDMGSTSSFEVEFDTCSNISNVTKFGADEGKVVYKNCTYVDALTCVGYGVGVPYVDANGIVSFLTNAEGGSYGS